MSKCSIFEADKAREAGCLGMCAEPHMCSYTWLCSAGSATGCQYGCSTPKVTEKSNVKLISLEQNEDSIKWTVTQDNRNIPAGEKTAALLLGQDAHGMWSLITEDVIVSTEYILDEYQMTKFEHIAVVIVSQTGIADMKQIPITIYESTEQVSSDKTSELVPEKLILPGKPNVEVSKSGSTQDVMLFVLAVITTLVTFTTLILFLVIINKRRQAKQSVPKAKIDPIIKDYSKLPSFVV